MKTKLKPLQVPDAYRYQTKSGKDHPGWKTVEKWCPNCERFKLVTPAFGLRWTARGGQRLRDPQSHCRHCRSKDSAERKRKAMREAV